MLALCQHKLCCGCTVKEISDLILLEITTCSSGSFSLLDQVSDPLHCMVKQMLVLAQQRNWCKGEASTLSWRVGVDGNYVSWLQQCCHQTYNYSWKQLETNGCRQINLTEKNRAVFRQSIGIRILFFSINFYSFYSHLW